MNISPNSTVILLKNVPLDNTYTDTIFFESITDQVNHFTSYTSRVFNQQTYQRVHRNRIRLQVVADDIYDYNYLMFRNTAYGNKWFYAFISSIEWVNNVTSEIEYEIDVLQTWFFNYELKPCFVEREHRAGGEIYQDTSLYTPENIDTGEIVRYNEKVYKDFSYGLLVGYLPWLDIETLSDVGELIAPNVFSGLSWRVFKFDSLGWKTDLNNFLLGFITTGHEDLIKVFKIIPWNYTSNDTGTYDNYNVTTCYIDRPTTLDLGYEPRNKKLLKYPFCFLNVDTCNDSRNYKWEKFEGRTDYSTQVVFKLVGVANEEPEILVIPRDYNGTAINDFNPLETVTCNGFPNATWRTDALFHTVGEVGKSFLKDAVASGIANTYGINTPMPTGLQGSISSVTDFLTFEQTSTMQGRSGSVGEIASEIKGIYFCYMGVRLEMAISIDNFFDRYGYNTSVIKVPNRDVRPHWCYCKTQNCNITGSVPVDDMKKIKSIYNNGITWWKNGSEVGDYTLDNTVEEP